ncbi:unnamed protein product [Prunus armeniaca]|uniref:Pentatricopeptide repeat-containing protein n=1 Tax=Prunus armeniaca TaxID=36596 RepID=A0A6J5VZT0_PRUAR|nr:unnamed protein product [Prunus armeniaca]CAB4294696.1 unnamed protein product [Prunus armeniaca]
MKAVNVAPVTYNTSIQAYNQEGNSEMGSRLFEEMSRNQVNANIVTYNALILGLCKEGRTKKAAYLVKELDRKRFVPYASTFSTLIEGQCVKKNSNHAFVNYFDLTPVLLSRVLELVPGEVWGVCV